MTTERQQKYYKGYKTVLIYAEDWSLLQALKDKTGKSMQRLASEAIRAGINVKRWRGRVEGPEGRA